MSFVTRAGTCAWCVVYCMLHAVYTVDHPPMGEKDGDESYVSRSPSCASVASLLNTSTQVQYNPDQTVIDNEFNETDSDEVRSYHCTLV